MPLGGLLYTLNGVGGEDAGSLVPRARLIKWLSKLELEHLDADDATRGAAAVARSGARREAL
eukprot:4339083-Prymnesium_polylepis.1